MEEQKVQTPPEPKAVISPFKRRKQLESDLEHITEEMYKRNKELAETNRLLSLLRTIDALALESHASLNDVCGHITEAIAQAAGYPLVGLLTRSASSKKELRLDGLSGTSLLGKDKNSLGISRPIHVSLSNSWFTDSLDSQKLLSIERFTAEDIANFLGCEEADAKNVRKVLQIKSMFVVKLLARRRLVGLLVVGFSSPVHEVLHTSTDFINRLSETIGVALDNKLLFEENQAVLRKLELSNKKLKALDETKDDFISMASHQLRTPLTSVKGYISMVMEGDAGKITPTQKDMLGQAFFSSQRMVYLIADLLNVSRLKTGKFVIDSSKVNLADVIEQEIGQLKETAAARNLTLSYDKPKDFPNLMLDETKIRQVIMNFIDNAIYYTPANGTINVKLKDSPKTVELRVEDNGIGVPKSEQHHLFTKFYRAGNARKARPDGTGLGLFMAKKVIMAQGGSLVFESQEGKGSTFGFTFNKDSLKSVSTATEEKQP